MKNEKIHTVVVSFENGEFYETNVDQGTTRKVTREEAKFPYLVESGVGSKIFTTEAEFQIIYG